MFYSGKIIDCHCHPFVLEKDNIAHYGFPVTADDFFAEMRRTGYAACCGSVILRMMEKTDFEDIRRANRYALELRERYGNFYIPGIHVHGEYPQESCAELEELYHKHGVRWIGELVTYIMHTGAYNCEGMFPIYETAQDLGMVVNIHESDLKIVEDVLKNFPKLSVVLAHPGDVGSAKERIRFLSEYPNGYLDISGTGIFRYGMLRHALDVMGSDRVLFGTDFPTCAPGVYEGGVLGEHLKEDELEKVFYKNFETLTGIVV